MVVMVLRMCKEAEGCLGHVMGSLLSETIIQKWQILPCTLKLRFLARSEYEYEYAYASDFRRDE